MQPRSLARRLTPFCVHLAHLAFHPSIQDGLSQFPTVTKFECRNFAFRDVTVQGIRAYPQILRGLPHVHHFTRFIHEEHHSSDTSHARETLCLTQLFDLHRVLPRVRPVSALSHSESTWVKGLTPAVVLRIRAIVVSDGVILGTVPNI